MNERDSMKDLLDIKKWVLTIWKNSLGIVVSLVIGIVLGLYISEGNIIEDCKYLSKFRIGSQAFTCQRTM